ncbi:MAG TPA: nitroreductase family protein [Acidobacteriaceae bacterium]|jgi:nitroreductase|nr:nitroreductase family protein [Acidobacteriaceae bacterium]
MASRVEKSFSEAVEQRRATPSFDGMPIPDADLKKILEAGLNAPSGYNLQPWRFVVVRTPEQRRRLRQASFNQAKVEEASAVIVACGDEDGWRTDMEEMIRMGRENGMTENYAEQARANIPEYLGNHPNLEAWLNRHVMIAVTSMMWMAETMGYDTAPMEGYEVDKVRDVLRLPFSYEVVALLCIGHLKGPDKFNGGRFSMQRTVFEGEYGKPIKL